MTFRCGKCDGLNVLDHHWSCPKRERPIPTKPPVEVKVDTPEKLATLKERLRRAGLLPKQGKG